MQNIAYGTPHSRTTSEVRTVGGVLRRRRLTLPFLLVALFAMGASMFLLLPNVFAQDASTVEYPEGGTDPVATFSAEDPEGATPITWGLLDSENGVSVDGTALTAADVADFTHFDINEDGELTFAIGDGNAPPDFEAPRGTGPISEANLNTYKVVVTAADSSSVEADVKTAYHKVTVKVTDVEEDGVVAWTTDANADNTVDDPKLIQFQVGAELVAGVTDGDLQGTSSDPADKTVVAENHDDVAADPTWRWYRSPSKTSAGTMIEDADSDTYTVALGDVGMYLRAVAYYLVTGNVDQEEASLTSGYRVLAARVGANKLKFDPAEIDRSVAEGEKDRNVGAPVRATGNHGAVNYTLADATSGDNNKFEIDQKTGQITTAVELNFDSAANQDDNCTALNSCVVTVRATDATGDATAEDAVDDPPVFIDATVTIKITNVDEKPTFSTGDKMVSVEEGTTVVDSDSDGDQRATTGESVYAATDPEDRTVTYRLMGTDGAKFHLKSSDDGVILEFREKPDFEDPTDRDRDNEYEVTVRASDGTLREDRMVSVTVANVDEEPEISGKESLTYAEGGTDPVATFTADDPEGVTPIIWDVLGNDVPIGDIDDVENADRVDGDHFDINEDGELAFAVGTADTSPDFEAPRGTGPASDDNTNTYKVVVTAADSSVEADAKTAYHKVTVKVTDVDEDGVVTWTVDPDGGANRLAATPEPLQFQVGASLVASATDGDIAGTDKDVAAGGGVVGVPVWEWYRGSAKIENPADDPNSYTVTLDDVGKSLRVKVTYTVTDNVNQESASLTSDYRVLATRVGANKLKFDPAEIDRSVAEGEKGRNVGAPVRATGNHGAVNYTLVDVTDNDDAKFEIDQKTGQITTAVELNFDSTANQDDNCIALNSCVVTVRATDVTGDATAEDADTNIFVDATVTITLTDMNEKPEFDEVTATAASPKALNSPEGQTALFEVGRVTGFVTTEGGVTYAATDPEGLNVNLTLMGTDGAKFQLSGAGVLEFREEPDFEDPTDRDRDNEYEVTVRASDGTLHEDRMVAVTVTDVDEEPEITITSEVVANTPPEFASAATTRTVAEDAAVGADIGARVEATDDDSGDTLTYTLSGTDAGSFDIARANGQLRTAVALDFETKTSYSVTVTATDSADAIDTIDVTITVTDVDDTADMTPLERYDDNNNDRIDKEELVEAIFDYNVNETLEKEDLVDLIFSYEVG